jgi:hypothetical protein
MDDALKTIVAPIVRHGLTYIGGILTSAGLVDASQTGNFAVIGTGIIMAGIGMIWSFVKNKKQA